MNENGIPGTPHVTRHSDAESGRQRITELRKRRRTSSVDVLASSRVTAIINIVIGLVSGLIFAVGLVYVFRFLAIRQSYMDPTIYKIFITVFSVLSAGWFVWLIVRIVRNVRRLRAVLRLRDEA